MEALNETFDSMPWLLPAIIILFIWDAIWKLIGLWKSARNDDLTWFIIIALISSVGIVPIIYILSNRKRDVRENV